MFIKYVKFIFLNFIYGKKFKVIIKNRVCGGRGEVIICGISKVVGCIDIEFGFRIIVEKGGILRFRSEIEEGEV